MTFHLPKQITTFAVNLGLSINEELNIKSQILSCIKIIMIIQKVILHNFKRFQHLELDLDPTMNIFIGDNESGKSTILQAIDLVARGSRTRIENIGIDRLFNVETIKSFMANINMDNLPEMFVELYFNPIHDRV